LAIYDHYLYVYVNPVPLINHDVVVTFSAVAIPFAAKVRLPVVPGPANLIVSLQAIVTVPAPLPFTKVSAVPRGYGTDPFAGIVKVLGVVSADG
jgi:hypothetical protein